MWALTRWPSACKLIESAQKSIELEFFIYEIDTASRLITQALARKAQEGVRVRLLVDFALPVFKLAPRYIQTLEKAGVEVRYYNTAGFERFFAAQHRTHRKLLVVDRQHAIIGGRNIADEYFDLSDSLQLPRQRSAHPRPHRRRHRRQLRTVLGLGLGQHTEHLSADVADTPSTAAVRDLLGERHSRPRVQLTDTLRHHTPRTHHQHLQRHPVRDRLPGLRRGAAQGVQGHQRAGPGSTARDHGREPLPGLARRWRGGGEAGGATGRAAALPDQQPATPPTLSTPWPAWPMASTACRCPTCRCGPTRASP